MDLYKSIFLLLSFKSNLRVIIPNWNQIPALSSQGLLRHLAPFGKTNWFVALKNINSLHWEKLKKHFLSEIKYPGDVKQRFNHFLTQELSKKKREEMKDKWGQPLKKTPISCAPKLKPHSFSLSTHHFPIRQSFDIAVRSPPQHFTSSPLSLSSLITSLHSHADSSFSASLIVRTLQSWWSTQGLSQSQSGVAHGGCHLQAKRRMLRINLPHLVTFYV